MTKVVLLERLRDFTLEATKDLLMPTKASKANPDGGRRTAEVHLMRLPDESAYKEKVPYITHSIITGTDNQAPGNSVSANATIRTIFAVYSENNSEGGLMLLNLMERLRIALLKQVIIGQQFQLDLAEGLEIVVYPDDTAPYFAGEMKSVWKMPPTRREVKC